MLTPGSYRVYDQAGFVPTLPPAGVYLREDLLFDPALHLLPGEWGYNKIDRLWFYASSDGITTVTDEMGYGTIPPHDHNGTYQPLDVDLTAIAALGFTQPGFLKKTAENTWIIEAVAGAQETDPIFSAHASFGITAQNILNWNAAFNWGNHALAGYLTSINQAQVEAVLVGTIISHNHSGIYAPINNPIFTGEVKIPLIANTWMKKMIVGESGHGLAYRDLNNPISFTDAPFGQYNIPTPQFNNLFYAAHKRFTVTQAGFSQWISEALFDGNYDQYSNQITTDNSEAVININLIDKGEYNSSYGLVYSQGAIYVHFYYTAYAEGVRARFKTKNSGTDFIWREYHEGIDISSSGGSRVFKIEMGSANWFCSEVEIRISTGALRAGSDPAFMVAVAEIEFIPNRSADYRTLPLVSKIADNQLYGNTHWKDDNNATTVAIERTTGIITASGGNSTQWNEGHTHSQTPHNVLTMANFSILEENNKIVFKYGNTVIASISSAGLIKAADDIEAFTTP